MLLVYRNHFLLDFFLIFNLRYWYVIFLLHLFGLRCSLDHFIWIGFFPRFKSCKLFPLYTFWKGTISEHNRFSSKNLIKRGKRNNVFKERKIRHNKEKSWELRTMAYLCEYQILTSFLRHEWWFTILAIVIGHLKLCYPFCPFKAHSLSICI